MPARFTTLNNAIEKGLETLKPDAAVKQIETWKAELEKVEVSGVKGLVHDLDALEKALHAPEPDGANVKTLLHKIGGETTRIAGKVEDEKVAANLKTLGEQLEKAGA